MINCNCVGSSLENVTDIILSALGILCHNRLTSECRQENMQNKQVSTVTNKNLEMRKHQTLTTREFLGLSLKGNRENVKVLYHHVEGALVRFMIESTIILVLRVWA